MSRFKKAVLFVFLIAFSLTFNLIGSSDLLAKNDDLKRSVLIVYPADAKNKDYDETFKKIITSFKHFDVGIKEISLNKYREALLDGFDVIFYIGADSSSLRKDSPFLRDVVKNYKSKTICWIHNGIEELFSSSGMEDYFSLTEPKVPYDSLEYKNTVLEGRSRFPYAVDIKSDHQQKAKIYGMFEGEDKGTLFCLNIDRFWYFSILPQYEDDYIVFCDILHLILDSESRERRFEKLAFILLESIDLDSQAEQIRDTYRFFAGLRAAFALEITPLKYTAQKVSTLSDDPFLLKNVSALLSTGGTAVLKIDDLDTVETIDEKIDELIDDDIIPLAFIDKRKYVMPKGRSINDNFSTAIERGDIPFIVYDGEFQRKIFIQNDFPDIGESQQASQIYEQAAKYSVLRDAVFGIAVPSKFDKKQFSKFIRHLRSLGYSFLDLRNMPNYVRSDSALIFSDSRYYAAMPYKDIIYANKKKIDLTRLQIDDKFISRQVFSPTLMKRSEKISKNAFSGTALIDLPPIDAVFVVKQLDETPTTYEKYQNRILNLIMGTETASWLDVVNRLTIWIILLMTVLLLCYLVYLLISQVRSSGYRGS